MEKELMADAYEQPQHRLVRKNSRSPSLRLRFGRRSDPSIGLYQVGSKEQKMVTHLENLGKLPLKRGRYSVRHCFVRVRNTMPEDRKQTKDESSVN